MYDVEVTVKNDVQLKDLQKRIEGLLKGLPEVTGEVELADTCGFEPDEPTGPADE